MEISELLSGKVQTTNCCGESGKKIWKMMAPTKNCLWLKLIEK